MRRRRGQEGGGGWEGGEKEGEIRRTGEGRGGLEVLRRRRGREGGGGGWKEEEEGGRRRRRVREGGVEEEEETGGGDVWRRCRRKIGRMTSRHINTLYMQYVGIYHRVSIVKFRGRAALCAPVYF